MLVIERLIGRSPEQDYRLMRALGKARWRRLLDDLAAVPLVTVPAGWEVQEGRVEASVRLAPGQAEALMRPAGPGGGRLPR